MLKKAELTEKVNQVLSSMDEQLSAALTCNTSEDTDGQGYNGYDSPLGKKYSDFSDVRPYISSTPDLIFACMELVQKVNSKKEISKAEINELLQPLRKSIAHFLLV